MGSASGGRFGQAEALGSSGGCPQGWWGLQLPGAVLGVLQPGLSHSSHNPTPWPDCPKQRKVPAPSVAALARCSALCTATKELSDFEHHCEDRSAAPGGELLLSCFSNAELC